MTLDVIIKARGNESTPSFVSCRVSLEVIHLLKVDYFC